MAWGRDSHPGSFLRVIRPRLTQAVNRLQLINHREAGGLEGGAGKRHTEAKPEACMDAGTKQSEMSWEKLKNQGSESSSACGPWRG